MPQGEHGCVGSKPRARTGQEGERDAATVRRADSADRAILVESERAPLA